jgi:hypothetical protein
MKHMALDEIYVKESKRIRMEYLKNSLYILRKEADINKYIQKLDDIKKEISESEDKSEEFFKSKLEEVDKHLTDAQKFIMPFYNKIEELNKDQHKLYVTIKEKYLDITDEQIYADIVPHVREIDAEFVKKNPDMIEYLDKGKK